MHYVEVIYVPISNAKEEKLYIMWINLSKSFIKREANKQNCYDLANLFKSNLHCLIVLFHIDTICSLEMLVLLTELVIAVCLCDY